DAQLDLQRPNEGTEHVQEHGFAAFLDHLEDFHVDQGSEDNGLAPFDFGRVIDLPHDLVCLVDAVDEGHAHVPRLEFELSQDGVAEGLGGDAGAVGNEENGAGMHEWAQLCFQIAARPTPAGAAYNHANYPIPSPHAPPRPIPTSTKPF